MTRSAIYRGEVMHARRDELARRRFAYPVYVAAIDLDELPALDRELRLFSHNGRNLFALADTDYAEGARGLATEHRALLAAHAMPPPHTTRLITNLRVLGYTFNPVSFFLGYDAAGALQTVVAEVNNTYGGRHRYVLGPAERIEASPRATEAGAGRLDGERDANDALGVAPAVVRPASRSRIGFRVPRAFFVSPFLHGEASYEFWFDAPLDGASLAITMHVDRPLESVERASDDHVPPRAEHERPVELASVDDAATADSFERIFVARLTGTREPLTDRALAKLAVRYPLMTLQVIGLIHYEAMKLRWHGVPYRRPGPDHRPLVEIPRR